MCTSTHFKLVCVRVCVCAGGSVSPRWFSTTGGDRVLTILGRDLKDRGEVALIAPSPPPGSPPATAAARLPCPARSWAAAGDAVTCAVPDGVGAGWRVEVTARQTVGVAADTLAFAAPEVTGVAPTTLPTTGGVVTITGRNFGNNVTLPGGPVVTVQVCVWGEATVCLRILCACVRM